MRRLNLFLAGLGIIGLATGAQSRSPLPKPEMRALQAAVANSTRSEANRARDRYRKPAETLSFFGIRRGQTVVELFPGGGWYSEILAPYILGGGGTYHVAAPDRGLNGFRTLAAKNPSVYGKAKLANFPLLQPGQTGVPDGSADVVLTFRNVHNWAMGEKPYADVAFKQIFAMLKPGGVLGIEEHRLPESADSAREKSSGYLKVSTVRRLAEQAGFRYVGSSEINANPKDTADWAEGVWTLPPTLRLGDKDKARYLAIGESDRMTLKFVKPVR
jgi:predicted methyltransferase